MEKNSLILKEKESEVDYLKMISVFIVCIVVLLLLIKVLHLTDLFGQNETVADSIMVIIAVITLFYTYLKYNDYREREKAEVLGQYNERYSRDEHVNKVVNYLISHIERKKSEKPSTHNMEMFMRFFEEMKLQIDKGRLNLKDVEELFSYYPMYLDAKPGLLKTLGIDDYDSNNWKSFHEFVELMAKFRLQDSEWKCTNDNWTNIIFDNNGRININGETSRYDYKNGTILTEKHTITYFLAGMFYDETILEDDLLVRENRKYTKQ